MDFESQVLVQQMQHAIGSGVKKGLAESKRYKAKMDAELMSRQFSAYSRLLIQFDGDLSVAATGAPTPNRSLSGEQLLELHDPDAEIHRLYVAIVPSETGGSAVFVWRRGESAPERFIHELRARPMQALPSIIVQFLFAHVENTFFSSKWWNTLSAQEQAHVRDLALMGNPYYTRWEYSELTVPWRVTSVSDNPSSGS